MGFYQSDTLKIKIHRIITALDLIKICSIGGVYTKKSLNMLIIRNNFSIIISRHFNAMVLG